MIGVESGAPGTNGLGFTSLIVCFANLPEKVASAVDGQMDDSNPASGQVRGRWREQDVAVKSGDNKGQTIPHRNVVREVKRLGAWRGKPAAFRLPAASEEGLKTVVLVQAGRGGRVIGVGEPKG